MEEGEPDIIEDPSPTQMVEGVLGDLEPETEELTIILLETVRE